MTVCLMVVTIHVVAVAVGELNTLLLEHTILQPQKKDCALGVAEEVRDGIVPCILVVIMPQVGQVGQAVYILD